MKLRLTQVCSLSWTFLLDILHIFILILVSTSTISSWSVSDDETAASEQVENSLAKNLPEFFDTIQNVTIALGREAKIICSVRNLGQHKVAWMRVEDQTILTIHEQVITRNDRIGLTNSEHRIWTLIINDAQEEDRGAYMCQVNTVPMMYQIAYLDVVVPPVIIPSETSTDVMSRENNNATLVCRAKGYPEPKVTWRREDGKPIQHGNWQDKKDQSMAEEFEGEVLTINRVSRLHMGAYLCIASNGVQPSVSHRIILNVLFPPMIWVPNQLIAASTASQVQLICNTEASPRSISYWTKDDQGTVAEKDRFSMKVFERGYKFEMILRISDVQEKDFGTYRCISRNSLGSTEGTIQLYKILGPVEKSGSLQELANARSSSSKNIFLTLISLKIGTFNVRIEILALIFCHFLLIQ
ncbi:lachesin-like [Brevipalpus obovatus]|uniref:lachesin-like n=1 Tax=Brevipalpus obovatus TaxID=246614 RepID=UPI003D9F3A62